MEHRYAPRARLAGLLVMAGLSGMGIWAAPAYSAVPTLTLTAQDPVVAQNGTTVLSWSSTGATSCTASGGWSGTKSRSGDATVGPIAVLTTYTLTCTGTDGTATAMVGIAVWGKVTVTWIPPDTRIDGSAYTNPNGYRLYFGTVSGVYPEVRRITNVSAIKKTLTLASGTYYFTLTAVDLRGVESAPSNEVVRVLK